jgi:hypothetical protein
MVGRGIPGSLFPNFDSATTDYIHQTNWKDDPVTFLDEDPEFPTYI